MLITIQNNDTIKRIEAFADTHGKHHEYKYDNEAIDILICAGDVCEMGDETQLRDFFVWFASQPAKHKLFVPGNHDLPFEFFPEYAAKYIPKGVTFLDNSGIVVDDIWFYAPPLKMKEVLTVPIHVDVLITHEPPTNILDYNGRWGSDYSLALAIEIEPKIHIFGHCHENGQQKTVIGKTSFYNVAIL